MNNGARQMASAAETIMQTLGEVFADLDAKMTANQKEWAKARVAAIAEFKKSPEVAERRADKKNVFGFSSWYYNKLFAIAGGKTWYNVFNGRNEAMINEFVEKNCRATAEKRNAKIARKLADVGVSAVIGSELQRSHDGFNGRFEVETLNQGTKVVLINTIYAGGYNIQCFHQRTLVKVH